ncbi:Bug family tripartite tricarboxylate transporter substrate binding protein [Deinococcus marmoris]|uniref:Tricarboxylate transport protein TctC n=1 Tax=Deinococcus marmoris TaxID=249408 RepID=A0A1U7P3Z6_9DEIO|nr:tripartite tricarboxylate transporter substrate-binding protein [Deinococcus marmoris]OLV19886.1 Tricarboxylate transport protein TctC [Deinococcus marmoris]
MSRIRRFTLIATATLLFTASAQAQSELKILAPASAGGGWDGTAQAIAETLRAEKLAPNVSVYNIPGKAGTLGLAEFVKLKGQPNNLMVTGFVMVAGIPINKSPYDLNSDVTPIARLTTSYEVLIVSAKSPYKTVEEMISAFKSNPSAIRFGGSSEGGSGHVAVGKLAKELKIPMSQVKFIPSAGGAQAAKAMLGGELDVVSAGYSEIEDMIRSGQVRGLAILAPEAVVGVNLPTLIAKGYNVDVSNWRGVVATGKISAAQRSDLTVMMTRMVRTDTWKKKLAENKWDAYFASGTTFDRFVRVQRTDVAQLLQDLNILK